MKQFFESLTDFFRSIKPYLFAIFAAAGAVAFMSKASSNKKRADKNADLLLELKRKGLDETSAEYQQAKADMEKAEGKADAALDAAKVKLDELAQVDPNGPDLLNDWNSDRLSKPS